MEVNWGKPPESPKLVIPCEKHGAVTTVACGECMRELHDRVYNAEALAKKRESASIAAHAMLVERNHHEQIKLELSAMIEYECQRAEQLADMLRELLPVADVYPGSSIVWKMEKIDKARELLKNIAPPRVSEEK